MTRLDKANRLEQISIMLQWCGVELEAVEGEVTYMVGQLHRLADLLQGDVDFQYEMYKRERAK